MELTDLQKQIMQLWADKSLSFGCLIVDKNHRSNSDELLLMQVVWYSESNLQWYPDLLYRQSPYAHYTQERNWINHILNERMDYRFKNENTGELRYEILWHPITYSRLCYLMEISRTAKKHRDMFRNILQTFNSNTKLYNQSILERPEELQLLVRDFLLSIQ